MSPPNAECLYRYTHRLYGDLIDNKERARLAADLRGSVDQILSYSVIGDQILSKSRALKERFPAELHNVSFDFTEFHSFKYLAIKDALDSLSTLSSHGWRREVQSILDLTELRMTQFTLHDGVNQLKAAISDLIVQARKRESPDDMSREKFAALLKELEVARSDAQNWLEKRQRTKKKLLSEREMSANLVSSLQRARDQFERDTQRMQIDMQRKEKELERLHGIGYDRMVLLREMESLRAQLAVEREHSANLRTKCDALARARDA
jgi:hypothetical protein